MKRELLGYLSCTACGGNFELDVLESDRLEVRSGMISCKACKKSHAINKGVVFLDDNISADAKLEQIASYKEISGAEARALWNSDWLANFPDNERLGLTPRADRNMRLSAGNAVKLIERLDLPRGASVLELGASICWLTGRLAAKGYYTVALDICFDEPKGLESADVMMRSRGVYFERVLADMAVLPFGDQMFDAVVISSALHHSPDVAGTLAEISRVLKRGGQLLLNEPSLGVFAGQGRHEVEQENAAGFHEGRYSINQWLAFLNAARFTARIYLPENLIDVLKSRGRLGCVGAGLLEILPQRIKNKILRIITLPVLFFFDGFFNGFCVKNDFYHNRKL